MDETQSAASGRAEHGWADVAIRLALVALIVYWSFLLLRPFIAILVWAAILSVALYPFYLCSLIRPLLRRLRRPIDSGRIRLHT